MAPLRSGPGMFDPPAVHARENDGQMSLLRKIQLAEQQSKKSE